ncbi:MAG: TetR/AcrR family transcriptional regulator [Polymorphum sp.]|nr:TetR/AcrR family transcriptional regulator [Polymorphum sp.]
MAAEDGLKPAKPPRGRAASVGLTREQIVAAAIAQIDEKGLAGFSLRELARALQVSPNVIYWHVGGTKEDLFAAISGAITSALPAGFDRSADWRIRLRQVFLGYRALVHEHPNLAPLLGAEMQSNGVANLGWVETVLAALRDGGFRGDELTRAFNALIGGLGGFVTMELAPGPQGGGSGWESHFQQQVAAIDPALYPLTHAALPEIANRIFVLRWQNGTQVPYGASYEFLLDLLINGLSALSEGRKCSSTQTED